MDLHRRMWSMLFCVLLGWCRCLVVSYFRYVDILIVYKDEHTDIHLVLDLFNNAFPTLLFTIEEEKTALTF